MQWNTAFIVTEVLLNCQVKSMCDSSCFPIILIARNAVFVVKKQVESPEISSQSSGVGAFKQDERNGDFCSM